MLTVNFVLKVSNIQLRKLRIILKILRLLQGGHPCLLFCYPQGEELFYYFGKVKDGTQCFKETRGVCIRGRCKVIFSVKTFIIHI